jgi:pimeloyl-ACP methyl ester carboxylesterase
MWALITHALTGGWLFAHTPAVFFNYASVNKTNPLMLAYYTCAMAAAVFPRDAKSILTNISKPCGLFIGQNDERFDPSKVIAYQEFLHNKQSTAAIIPEANHLSIVLKAPALFEKMRQRL